MLGKKEDKLSAKLTWSKDEPVKLQLVSLPESEPFIYNLLSFNLYLIATLYLVPTV